MPPDPTLDPTPAPTPTPTPAPDDLAKVDDKEPAAAARLVLAAEPASMLDGTVHIGIAVGLRTGDKPSALVVPDVLGVAGGTAPVYLAKPLTLNLVKIQNYLEKKAPDQNSELKKNEKLNRFLTNTDVAINSLYFRNGKDAKPAVAAVAAVGGKAAIPATAEVKKIQRLLLMQFDVDFDAGKKKETAAEKASGGLIGSLTGDPDLSELFDITSLSLRILQCDEENVETLQKYIDAVSED